ncbi:bifunctional biotin--[acetyl-CoA-carboxylase] ligase/biotin operon repressor BirA [Halomonas shantousis]
MTIGDLIRLLSDGGYHSGEQLGEALGVSRTAVWKQLKKLEAMALPLEAVKGRGYRLAQPLDLLDGTLIDHDLAAHSRRCMKALFIKDDLPSTNTFLRERFQLGAGHAEVCLAESQTAGRGRRGRNWVTSWGGSILFSMGWRFEGGVATLEGLSLAVGVALAQVLEDLGACVALKWPNDVLLIQAGQRYKLAGILLEVSGDVAGPCEVVIGIGVNVALPASLQGSIGQPAAGLRDVIPDVSRNGLAAGMINAMFEMLPRFEREGFAPWQEAWNRRNAHAGEVIEVQQGRTAYQAMAQGVDASGNLLVQTEGRLQTLAGGEISLRGLT